jgi:hypothetical protein
MRIHKPAKKNIFTFIGSLLIITVSAALFSHFTSPAKASWFNDSWAFRTAIVINNSGSAVTNQKVNLSIDTRSGSGQPMENKIQTTCADSRFTDINGAPLKYYIDTGTGACNTAATSYWVLLPAINAGDTVIYHYYGNPTAAAGTQAANFSETTFSPASTSSNTEEIGLAPIAYWSLDDGTGQTVNNNTAVSANGTLGANSSANTDDPTWQYSDTCVNTGCLKFTSANSTYVNVANTVPNVKTVSFWVYPYSTTQSLMVLNGAAGNASISVSSGAVSAGAGFASPAIYIDGKPTSTLVANQWQMVTITTATAISASNTMFGRVNTGYLNGLMDEIKFYNYARSAAQIAADYVSHSGRGASLSIASSRNATLQNGLVGWWKMDETSGNPADSSGNGNSLTNNATVTFVAGKFGNAANLVSTSNQYLSTTTSITGIQTVSFWVNPTATTTYFVDLDGTNTISASSGTISTSGSGWSSPQIFVNGISSSVLQANVWQLVTVTSAAGINTGTMAFGKVGSNYFNGKIDGIRLYNRRLSTSEIETLYNWAPPPIAYWKFDETSGTVAADSSGNGNTANQGGSPTSPVNIPGKYGRSVYFTNNTYYDAAATTSLNTLTGTFTVEAWVNAATLDSTYRRIVTRNTTPQDWYMENNGGTPGSILYFCGGTGSNDSTDFVMSTNTWYHLAMVNDGSSCRIYVDGTQVSQADIIGSPSITGDIGIGANPGGGTNWLGAIDDFRIYNYARTPRQVSQDAYYGQTINSLSPAIYWSFDEQNGSVAHNSSSNPNFVTGTISGTTWKTGSNCKVNGCLNFGTSTDFVSAGDPVSIDGLAHLSLSFWVKPNTLAVDKTIISKADFKTSGGNNVFAIAVDHTTSSELRAYWATSGNDIGTYFTTSGLGLTNGTWAHIAIVYNTDLPANQRIKVYKNGQPIGGTITGSLPGGFVYYTTSNLRVGASAAASTYTALDASLDEVKIYYLALTPSDVLTDYNYGSALSTSIAAAQTNEGTGGNPPVAWWKMNEASWNGTTGEVKDSSGNNRNGTSSNATVVPGKIGNAARFNGTTSYLDMLHDSAYTTDTKTLSFWVRFNQLASVKGEEEMLVFKNISVDPWVSYQLYLGTDDTLYFDWWTPTNKYTVTNPDALLANTWYYVTVVKDTSIMRLYINGIEDAYPTVTSGSEITSDSDLTLGAVNTNQKRLDGFMDDFKFYNYARTPAQVAYDYNRGAPVAHWNFDECQGTVLHDVSPKSDRTSATLNGTITIGATGSYTSPGTCNSGIATDAWNAGTSGKYSSSLGFDGSNDYVTISDQPYFSPYNNNLTISVWAKVPTAASASGNGTCGGTGSYLFSKGDTDQYEWALENDNNTKICLLVWPLDGNGGENAFKDITVNDNAWHMYTGVFNYGSTLNLYIDGVLADSSSLDTTMGDGTAVVQLGRISNRSYFSGMLDDARIYNYALTATQIKTLYNENSSIRFGP